MNAVVKTYLALFGLSVEQIGQLFSENELEKIRHTLNHGEERNSTKRDDRGNWDYQHSSLPVDGPFLDRFVLSKMKSAGVNRVSPWPSNAPFAACITHDVDRVESYSPTSFLRNIKKRQKFEGRVLNRASLEILKFKTWLKKQIHQKSTDPLWQYEKWFEMERQYGMSSTYFFFVHPGMDNIALFDCDYKMTDLMKYNGDFTIVSDFIKLVVRNGDKIGLHGSINSSVDTTLLKKQKEILEGTLGNQVYATRQHYLRYDINQTTRVHLESGFSIDSSLGFTTKPGFRVGTAYPYLLYSGESYILEIPLLLMDTALLRNPELRYDEACAQASRMIDLVEEVGGCLTINFHPDYIVLDDYVNVFQFILKQLAMRNAAVLNMEQIRDCITRSAATLSNN